MKILYKKEKGVSPVIATILMVAITVVLASAVYLMVSGYIGTSPSKPVAVSITPSQLSNGTEFLVTSGNMSITSSSPLIITISNATGTWTFTINGLPATTTYKGTYTGTGSPTYNVNAWVYLGATGYSHYIAGGDYILIYTSANLPLASGTHVTFTYNGAAIYSTTL